MAVPAGAGQTVESFIHAGSSARLGIGSWLWCVPGIWRIGPLVGSVSQILQLSKLLIKQMINSQATINPHCSQLANANKKQTIF